MRPESGNAAAVAAALLGPPLRQIGAELRRMGTLGSAESANALFHGHVAFTQYGPGQYTPEVFRGVHGPEQPDTPQQQQRRGRGR